MSDHSDHYTTFQDVFSTDGVRIEFSYTKAIGNRWNVVASVASGNTFTEIYTATAERPESIEDLFVTHRIAVSHIITSWAHAVQPKEKGKTHD